MKKHISFFLCLFIAFANIKAQNIARIEFLLDSTYKASPFFGNILIRKNKETLLEKSYGYADAPHQKALTNKNSFQVASISKQFTAYGIMILKSRNLLDYDSMVYKYIPTFPYTNISVRHLLTHTSGLPNFWDDIRLNLDTSKSNGNKDVLAYLIKNNMPLQFRPGTAFQYADIGYDFLATIIENISGLSYQEFMQKNIFEPLKMKDTYAYMVTDITRIKNNDLAIGHVMVNGKFEYAHLQDKFRFVKYLGDFYGDGSVVSSARDLAIWDQAIKDCTLLSCDIQNESTSTPIFDGKPFYARTNPDVSYGFGWFIKDSEAGKIIYHSGGHPGNTHVFYRLPNKNICYIFLSNAETANVKSLRNNILQLLSE